MVLLVSLVGSRTCVHGDELAARSTTPRDRYAERRFVVASSNNFPPVNQLDGDGRLIGFGHDLATAVIESIGGTATHIHSDRWTEVIGWLDSGRADFIHGAVYTKERDEFLDYTDPILTLPEVIFVRTDRYDIQGIESLNGKRVACVDMQISHLYLQRFSGIERKIVDRPVEGMYLLVNGDVDAFIHPKQLVLSLAQRLRLNDRIKITGDPLRSLTWSMVVKEGNGEVLALLNRGIERVRASGEYERIYNKWFGLHILAGYSARELKVIAGLTAGASVAVVLSLALMVFNRRLRRSKRALEEKDAYNRQTKKALRLSEQRFERAVRGTSDGLWDWDIETNEVWFAPRFEELLGFARGELGDSHEAGKMRLHPDEREWILRQVRLHLDENVPFDNEFRLRHKSGEYVWFRVRGMAVRDDAGKPIRMAGSIQDITERKHAGQLRVSLEQQLRQSQKMEAVGTLAAGIAHDFNNTLMAIVGFAESARTEGVGAEAVTRALDGICGASFQAARLTKSLLVFSCDAAADKSPQNMATLVRDSVDMVRHMFPTSIAIATDVPNDADLCVRGDASQLQQVLINLAINARDAVTKSGQVEIAVRHRPLDDPSIFPAIAGRTRGAVLLVVKDDGCGMTSETRERIFEPFFTTKPRGKGTGLGLAVVHGIVHDHGGQIAVQSELGRGTTITVALPSCPSDTRNTDADVHVAVPDGNGEQLLLAEDNDDVRGLMSAALASAGYKVACAVDGCSALELFKERELDWDLLILDVDMPKTDGLTCLKRMRTDRPDIPAILISGLSMARNDADAQLAVRMQKPFSTADLRVQVHRLLSSAEDDKANPEAAGLGEHAAGGSSVPAGVGPDAKPLS